jgi:hypothetical protein
MPAEVEKVVVSVPGLCLPAPTWKFIGVVWTVHGPVQTFLRPVAALPMELVPVEGKDKA